MAQKWFKFYGQDWLTDSKVIKLDPIQRLCFITLLCMASASDVQGTIKDLDEETLLLMTHLYNDPYEDVNDYTRCKGILKILAGNGMITNDDGMITIKNFVRRQDIQLTPYERTKRYRQNNNEKIKARNTVSRAITTGQIKKKACEVCGDKKAEAHHDDYTKPLNIRWLCKKHHEDHDHDHTREEENRIDKNRKEKKLDSPLQLYNSFKSNSLWERIVNKYPDRDYHYQFELMIDWWKTNKNKLPQNISSFENWLKNTKADPDLQKARMAEIKRVEDKKRQDELDKIPLAKPETLDKLREGINKLKTKF